MQEPARRTRISASNAQYPSLTTTTANTSSSSAHSRPTCTRYAQRWIGAAYSFVQWRKLRTFEASICRVADHVLAVSDADAAALQRLVPELDVTVVPNGIDVDKLCYPHPRPFPRRCFADRRRDASLVFTGTMDFRPNVDAALWFAQEVLPLIRQEEPGARFVIVGQKPHRRLDTSSRS